MRPPTDQPDAALVTAPVVLPSTTGEFIVSATVVTHFVTGPHAGSPFTFDSNVRSNAWSHPTSNAAPALPYAGQWDQNIAGPFAAFTVAFRP